jgi:hypothetical protein
MFMAKIHYLVTFLFVSIAAAYALAVVLTRRETTNPANCSENT